MKNKFKQLGFKKLPSDPQKCFNPNCPSHKENKKTLCNYKDSKNVYYVGCEMCGEYITLNKEEYVQSISLPFKEARGPLKWNLKIICSDPKCLNWSFKTNICLNIFVLPLCNYSKLI